MSYTCLRCGRTSYNPNDAREEYCGYCRDWTGNKSQIGVKMHHLVVYTLGSSSQPLHVDVEEDQYNLLLTRDVRWLKALQAGGKVLRIRTNAIVFFLEPTEKHE